MKVLSSAAMKEADRHTIEDIGLPGAVLMETAGIRVVEFILSHKPDRGKVVILAGPGNNGGDGLVIARLLHKAGFDVSLYSTVKPGNYRGDAGINERYLDQTLFPINRLLEEKDLKLFNEELAGADLLIDALLGIGTDREVKGLMAGLIEALNNATSPVLAVDIPSGLHGDTGRVMGCAVQADWTVTFAFPKAGLFNDQGVDYAGEVYIADINIPSSLVENEPLELLTAEKVAAFLPPRPNSSHKGSMGRVYLVAGSPGMGGAAVMAGESALQSGAGLVYLAGPKSLIQTLESGVVEVITTGLPDKEPGIISPDAVNIILDHSKTCNVLAVGPGLRPGEDTAFLLEGLIEKCPLPLVLDAGALEALTGNTGLLKQAKVPPVLTPHPGEMSRLIGTGIREVMENRLEIARQYAQEWNAILILKGYNTVVAFPSGKAALNPTGGPALATAGSGDLLTGTIASFIAQGMNSEAAAMSGVFVHGLAGDLVSKGRGHMARDVLNRYKEAFQYLEKPDQGWKYGPFLTRVRPY